MANAVYDDEKEKTSGHHDDLGVHPERHEAEVADLEKQYNAPSADEPDYEKKSLAPDQLDEAESNTEGAGSTKGEYQEKQALADNENQIGEGYKEEGKKKVRGRFSTRQKVAGGGVIGIIIAAIFGGFTILSGPFQFIHIAQILRGFHFSNQEDAGDDRMLKIGRYIRYGRTNPEKTRLNFLGNKYADLIEGKMNKSGIESGYNRLGYLDGYIIDPIKIQDSSEFAEIKNKSPDEVVSHFKEKYGVDLNYNAESKVFHADADGLGYFKSRKMVRTMLQESGYSKIGAALRARIMGKRAGIPWHPMKKLDRKILTSLDARFKKWSEERQKRITNGADKTDPTFRGEEKTDADGNKISDPNLDAAAEAADGAIPPHNATETPSARIETAKAHPGLAKGATISAVVGLVCAAKGIAQNIDDVKHTNVALPLMRLGMESIIIGNQVMNGNDVDAEQLGFLSKQLSDPELGSWASARSIQAENGQELTGPDIRPEAEINNEKNAVVQFLNSIPGLGGVCGVAAGAFGFIVTTTLDVFTGPVSAAVGLGLSAAVGPTVVNGLVHWLAGEQIDLNVAGADYGNYINYGARLAANDSLIAAGGTELNTKEAYQLKLHQLNSQREDQATKSFAERMFNPYDSNSLVSRIIDKQDPDVSSNVASLTSSTLKINSVFFNILRSFSSIFSNKVSAATNASYSYGFPEYGFSVDELNNDSVKNPFQNAEKAIDILTGPKGQEYIEKAKSCFNIIVGTDGTVTSQDSTSPYFKIPEDCHTDNSPDWLSIRFYIFDTQVMESAACYQDDTQACQDIGFGVTGGGNSNNIPTPNITVIGPVGDIGESSDSVACAAGTKDMGVVQSKYSGNVKKTAGPLMMRLCQLGSIAGRGNDTNGKEISGGAVVNSRVSGTWQALGAQATTDGVPLAASSSFRLNDSCNGTGDGSACATPGRSSHQLGIAIDFVGNIAQIKGSSTTSCSGRARDTNSKAWNWLYANAEKFGIKQYSYEAWHWDLLNSPSRCGAG